MARIGMMALIHQMRVWCAADVNQLQVNGVSYWTDDQLEAELDATVQHFAEVPLIPAPRFEAGLYRWHEYLISPRVGRFLEYGAPDDGFAVRDSGGHIVVGYAINLRAMRLTFSEDQRGAEYTLNARAYRIYRAAARIWEQKAAFAAANIAWSIGDHTLKGDQLYEQCMAQAQRFWRLDGVKSSPLRRVDEV